jgi:DNA (cytosine-5)-methyltransferase 1
MNKIFKVIDLFSGCGGLSKGFLDAGYQVPLGIDYSKDAIKTFDYNHPDSKGIVADLLTKTPLEIQEDVGIKDIDVIIGGPPCQGFSLAGKRIIDDDRNKLYQSFVAFVKHFQPKAFLMENVPNIISMGKGAVKDAIITEFEELGYTVTYKILLASDFGVPQNRKRAFFIGLQNDITFSFPSKKTLEKINSFNAISDLPEDSVEDNTPYVLNSLSTYQTIMRKKSTGIYNHQITNHKEKTVGIIALVPDGGNYKSLPKELQQTRNVNIAWTRLNSQKPSFTIDTGHRHHFHYKFNRVPTVRESARIQSFGDDFIFLGSKTSQYRQVGNAVPPLLAKALAEQLKQYL